MIIYGIRTTHLLTQPILENCSNCNELNSLNMSIYQRYGHIFWISFFPVGKFGATHCSHCQQELYHKQFDFSMRDHYIALKSQAKTPIWTFSLLIVIAVIAIMVTIGTRYHEYQNITNILNPQKGDIYEIKRSWEDQANSVGLPKIASNSSTDFMAKYTLYKVDSVANDEVYLLPNNYESNLREGLKDIKNDTAFSSETFYLLKSEIKTLFDNGEIVDIER